MINDVHAVDIAKIFPPAQHFNTFASVIALFIPLVFVTTTIITLFTLIYGSYLFITAGGESEHLQSVKKIYKWGILGFVIVMVSYLLARVVSRILNIDLYI